MPTVTLRPNATNGNHSAANNLYGAASYHVATSDDSDASYAYLIGSASDHVMTFGLTTFAIPAGALIKLLRIRARGKRTFSTSNTLQTYHLLDAAGNTITTETTMAFVDTTLITVSMPGVAATIPQATLDGLQLDIWHRGEALEYREFYVDVTYAETAVTAITYPTGNPTITLTSTPTITWTHTPGADGGAQTRYQVQVYAGAALVYDTGEVVSAAASHLLPPLANAAYTVHVRTAQTTNGATHWATTDTETFTMNVPGPIVDHVDAGVDSSRGRIVIEADLGLAVTPHVKATAFDFQRSIDGGTTWVDVRGGARRDAQAVISDLPVLHLPTGSTDWVQTADHASLDVTGDLTLIAHVAADDWTTGANQMLISKWSNNQQSYAMLIEETGFLQYWFTTDGTTLTGAQSSAAMTSDGTWRWVAVTHDVADGGNNVVRFWVSTDGIEWVFISQTTGAGNVVRFSGTALLKAGGGDPGSQGLDGMLRRAQVRSGIGALGVPGGTVVADWHVQPDGGNYTDWTGRVWNDVGALHVHDHSGAMTQGSVLFDYEAPQCTSLLYRARGLTDASGALIAGDWTTSAAVSWCPPQQVWLKDPNDSSLNLLVSLVAAPSLERPRRQALYDVLGAEYPIVRSDVLGSPRGTLAFCTSTKAEATTLLALLRSSVLLLQVPEGVDGCPEVDGGWGSRYIAVGSVTEGRLTTRLTPPMRVWSVPFVEVDVPADASL